LKLLLLLLALAGAAVLGGCSSDSGGSSGGGGTDPADLARQLERQVNIDYPEVKLSNTSCIKKSDTEFTCLGNNTPPNTVDGPRSIFDVTVSADGGFIYKQAP
jgi:hypothetical protein